MSDTMSDHAAGSSPLGASMNGVRDRLRWAVVVVARPFLPHAARMNDPAVITLDWLLLAVRAAGVFHLLTLLFACFTPIPAGWEENLRRLPEIHRRFAIAQNFAIGATTALLGLVCLGFAPVLVDGSPGGRILCGVIALWWGGRLVILPWLRIWPELKRPLLRIGFVFLVAECAIYAVAFGWLALERIH